MCVGSCCAVSTGYRYNPEKGDLEISFVDYVGPATDKNNIKAGGEDGRATFDFFQSAWRDLLADDELLQGVTDISMWSDGGPHHFKVVISLDALHELLDVGGCCWILLDVAAVLLDGIRWHWMVLLATDVTGRKALRCISLYVTNGHHKIHHNTSKGVGAYLGPNTEPLNLCALGGAGGHKGGLVFGLTQLVKKHRLHHYLKFKFDAKYKVWGCLSEPKIELPPTQAPVGKPHRCRACRASNDPAKRAQCDTHIYSNRQKCPSRGRKPTAFPSKRMNNASMVCTVHCELADSQ